nr:EOG090X06KU [Eubosmina coregoni]
MSWRSSSFRICIVFLFVSQVCRAGREDVSDLPDGYFPFEESPSRTPPKVRRPPYAQTDVDCPGLAEPVVPGTNSVQSLDNLCGDLNKGYIPKSPMGRNVQGQSYPFELIRNRTLDFFSSTLPILKADQNLPKVAKYEDFDLVDRSGEPLWKKRTIRSSDAEQVDKSDMETSRRQARGLCDKNYGIVCTIMNMINGRLNSALNPQSSIERVENPDLHPSNNYHTKHSNNAIGDDPLTPCPSAAEYVTPVYAKNYQGVWRYVVQIPYEGYFTQTVEVTKCLRKKCHFMDGSCLASPRWVSLLVAELFYPHARFPGTKPGDRMEEQEEQDSKNKDVREEELVANRDKRQIGPEATTAKPTYCDGVDEIGCYQLIPHVVFFYNFQGLLLNRFLIPEEITFICQPFVSPGNKRLAEILLQVRGPSNVKKLIIIRKKKRNKNVKDAGVNRIHIFLYLLWLEWLMINGATKVVITDMSLQSSRTV